ncbi:hypothetical protein [Sediminitomix flava]|uniref:hypothetical protein n=1 Tax=Sediminitomix flava TaxID=379075 RepID=UPI0011B1F5D6|nr:hypothetical protein [Sediminitomix flava]
MEFEGVCGIGSDSNIDCDKILEIAVDRVEKFNGCQGLIFDFRSMNYQFGNRFLRLFNTNNIKRNKYFPISIITTSENIENWRSLIEYASLDIEFLNVEKAVFHLEFQSAISSIRRRLNKK